MKTIITIKLTDFEALTFREIIESNIVPDDLNSEELNVMGDIQEQLKEQLGEGE